MPLRSILGLVALALATVSLANDIIPVITQPFRFSYDVEQTTDGKLEHGECVITESPGRYYENLSGTSAAYTVLCANNLTWYSAGGSVSASEGAKIGLANNSLPLPFRGSSSPRYRLVAEMLNTLPAERQDAVRRDASEKGFEQVAEVGLDNVQPVFIKGNVGQECEITIGYPQSIHAVIKIHQYQKVHQVLVPSKYTIEASPGTSQPRSSYTFTLRDAKLGEGDIVAPRSDDFIKPGQTVMLFLKSGDNQVDTIPMSFAGESALPGAIEVMKKDIVEIDKQNKPAPIGISSYLMAVAILLSASALAVLFVKWKRPLGKY